MVKTGRPRKVYMSGDEPVQITINLTRRIKELIPVDKSMSQVVRELIIEKYDTGTRRIQVE